jgi:hypothetical protein
LLVRKKAFQPFSSWFVGLRGPGPNAIKELHKLSSSQALALHKSSQQKK